jgi:hypothetical protein
MINQFNNTMSNENANTQHFQGEFWPQGQRIQRLRDAVQKRLSAVQQQNSVINRDPNLDYSLFSLFDAFDLDYVRDNIHLLADRFAWYVSRMNVEKDNTPPPLQDANHGFFQSPEFRGK